MLSAFLPIIGTAAETETNYYLLTGQQFSETDKAAYQEWNKKIYSDEELNYSFAGNSLSYTWDDWENAVGTTDGTKSAPANKLTDGKILQAGGGYVVNTVGKYMKPTVIFDLGAKYAVDRVDVLQNNNASYNLMKEANVYVSTDGTNYVQAGNKKVDTTKDKVTDTDTFLMSSVKFDKTAARYVKIEMLVNSQKMIACEAMIFGYASALTKVESAVEKANTYLAENSAKWYTADSVTALKTAVDAAAELTETSAQADIDSVISGIENGINNLVSVNERLVVSGNNIYYAKEYYKTLTPSITLKNASNTPSYSWEDDTVADKDNKQLTEGHASAASTSYAANTNSASVSATFDLGTTAVVDRTDVFTVSNATKSGQKKTKEASVFYSMNGTDWTKLETKAVEGANEDLAAGTSKARHTIFTFAPVTAKYIKVNFVKADGAMNQFLSEVIIFGIGSDFSALTSKINEYSDISLLEKYATAESYNALNTKLTEAKAMVNAQTASPDEIAAKAAEIDEAFNAISYKVSDYGILSNNLVTTTKENQEKENPTNVEGDKDLYAPLDNVNVGMTLLNEDLTPNTDITNALFGGHILEGDGKYGYFYAYDNTKPATNTVIADATEEVYFTGTDLYECYRKGTKTPTRTIDKVTVYVSSNGTDFEKVCEINNDCNEDTGATDGIINKIGTNFMPVKGRYLKFVFTSSQYKAQVPFELVIKGFKDPNALHYPLSCEATYYIVGTDGETVIEDGIAGADAIWVGYNVINNSSEDKNYNIYAAIYNSENKLLAVKQAAASETEGTELEATFTELGGLAAGSYMVSYIWDGMTPMAAPLER